MKYLEQLTKPEILNGEQVVNIQLTNNEIKLLHESLVNKIQLAKNVGEQNIQGMTTQENSSTNFERNLILLITYLFENYRTHFRLNLKTEQVKSSHC